MEGRPLWRPYDFGTGQRRPSKGIVRAVDPKPACRGGLNLDEERLLADKFVIDLPACL